MDRRDFLKNTTLLAASAILPAAAPLARSAPEDPQWTKDEMDYLKAKGAPPYVVVLTPRQFAKFKEHLHGLNVIVQARIPV